MNPVALIVGLVQVLGPARATQVQPFVPGEALLRFAAGSAGEKALRQSALSTPADLTILEGPLNGVGARARVPLRPVRVGGGGWLVVRIRRDELARQVRDRLARCREVAQVTHEQGDTGKVNARITFRDGSRSARLLERAGGPGGKSQVDSLVAHIARRIGTPLKGAASGSELQVEVDLDDLTLQLIERLKALREVESAQPNYRVRGFGPRPT